MRHITRIVVHCTGTRPRVRPEAIERHFARMGWRRAGYHYVIDHQGRVYNLVPLELVANGVRGYNADSIHVAYIGGLGDDLLPADTRTPEQRNTLTSMMQRLCRCYPEAKVVGHRDLSPDRNGDGRIDRWEWVKQCPCFDAQAEYGDGCNQADCMP